MPEQRASNQQNGSSVGQELPGTQPEAAVVNWMAQDEITDRLGHILVNEHGEDWHDFTIDDIAEVAVQALVDNAVLVPSHRWDEDCHSCGGRVGDHTLDGRCPREPEDDFDD